jgi:hypothetical protein
MKILLLAGIEKKIEIFDEDQKLNNKTNNEKKEKDENDEKYLILFN